MDRLLTAPATGRRWWMDPIRGCKSHMRPRDLHPRIGSIRRPRVARAVSSLSVTVSAISARLRPLRFEASVRRLQ